MSRLVTISPLPWYKTYNSSHSGVHKSIHTRNTQSLSYIYFLSYLYFQRLCICQFVLSVCSLVNEQKHEHIPQLILQLTLMLKNKFSKLFRGWSAFSSQRVLKPLNGCKSTGWNPERVALIIGVMVAPHLNHRHIMNFQGQFGAENPLISTPVSVFTCVLSKL